MTTIEPSRPTSEAIPALNPPKYVGVDADRERDNRHASHHYEFTQFVAEANRRSIKRKDLETRNKIWDDGVAKAKKRIEEIGEEKIKLERKIEGMEGVKEQYNEENRQGKSEEEDRAKKASWERYFNLESEDLPV